MTHRLISRFAHGALTLCATAFVAMSAQAVVIDHANVAGFKTFQDLNTGRVWLDMNNFFNMTTDDMVTAAAAGGFTFATTADVNGLLGSLPLTGGEWPGYKAIMGDAPNRELIWGSYDDGTPGNVGWAFSFSGDSTWSFVDDATASNGVPNGGSPDADMNIWAYQTGVAAVPEAETYALMLAGLGVLGAAVRRRKPNLG